jgi:hypothetical protein
MSTALSLRECPRMVYGAITTLTSYIDPDADTGGDGTTNALTGANCAYKSLSICEAAEQAKHSDITGVNGYIEEWIVCSNHANHTADTTALLISGWTTSATTYIYIHSETASRHVGIWDATKYRLVVAGAITNYEDYVRIDGLQIDPAGGVGIDYGIATATTNEMRISNCLIKGNGGTANTETGIRVSDSDAIVNIWNCISYNISTKGASNVGAFYIETAATVNIYSCVGTGGYRTFYRAAGTVTAKNCYAGGNGGAGDYVGTIGLTTCASSDTTGSAAALRNIAVSTTADATHAGFTNVTAGSENFAIKVGSPLIDVGTDTHGESAPLDFSSDIIGVARGAIWDVGAFEYVAAAGAVVHRLTLLGVGP